MSLQLLYARPGTPRYNEASLFAAHQYMDRLETANTPQPDIFCCVMHKNIMAGTIGLYTKREAKMIGRLMKPEVAVRYGVWHKDSCEIGAYTLLKGPDNMRRACGLVAGITLYAAEKRLRTAFVTCAPTLKRMERYLPYRLECLGEPNVKHVPAEILLAWERFFAARRRFYRYSIPSCHTSRDALRSLRINLPQYA